MNPINHLPPLLVLLALSLRHRGRVRRVSRSEISRVGRIGRSRSSSSSSILSTLLPGAARARSLLASFSAFDCPLRAFGRLPDLVAGGNGGGALPGGAGPEGGGKFGCCCCC